MMGILAVCVLAIIVVVVIYQWTKDDAIKYSGLTDVTDNSIEIIDVTIEVTEPVNIMEDGTRDPDASMWVHGGTGYLFQTNQGVFDLELDGKTWYDPSWQISGDSAVDVIARVIAIEIDYCKTMKEQDEK